MVFSSIQFIYVFLPIFFLCYFFSPKKFKNAALFLGSLCFYYVGAKDNLEHFFLFLASIALDYLVGIFIENMPKYKKQILAVGIGFHLISLGIFKYLGFLTFELGKRFSWDVAFDLVLPIGISFYTFQGLSYIIDVYRGTVRAERSFINYGAYISMFEQLIAGPIVTYGAISNELKNRTVKPVNMIRGFGIFTFGLGLKVLLANPIGKLWSDVGAIGFESISTPLAWMAIIAYSFQIYFDFFGYSVMAMGLGKMLGFKIPKNFDHPYLSLSMTEFWRRWHITLGSWFREYVYIPLGGNRNGAVALIRNFLVVWLLTGIWHGAGYNFILWGVVLFVILMIERFFLKKYLEKIPILGHIYMILLIPLSWAIFAIEDKEQLVVFFTRLFPFLGDQGPWSIFKDDYLKYLKDYWYFFVIGLIFSTRLPYNMLKLLKKRNKIVPILIILLAILAGSTYCMYIGLDDPFMYFRF